MTNNNPFIPGGNPSPMPMPGNPQNNNDSFEVDLTGVEVGGGFTVPDGVYRVRCINVEQSVSKGGNPMFVFEFEISEGPKAGFKSKVFTAITPAAMWKVAETVIALGVGQEGSMVKFKRSEVINKECGAHFETSEYNGQNRSQITRLMTLAELAEATK